jgi:hypothetical protein
MGGTPQAGSGQGRAEKARNGRWHHRRLPSTADLRRTCISDVGTEPDSTALSHLMTGTGNRILVYLGAFHDREGSLACWQLKVFVIMFDG